MAIMRSATLLLFAVLLGSASTAAAAPNIVLLFADDLGLRRPLACTATRRSARHPRQACRRWTEDDRVLLRAVMRAGPDPAHAWALPEPGGRRQNERRWGWWDAPGPDNTRRSTSVRGLSHRNGRQVAPGLPTPRVPARRPRLRLVVRTAVLERHDQALGSDGRTAVALPECRKGRASVDQDTLTVRYTREIEAVIRDDSEQPFFAYLAYSMPHLPLRTAGVFRGTSRAGLYGDVIEAIDWSASVILQALEERGVADNTIVVFTSDNGPWLNLPDRMISGGVVPWHAGSPGPLRGAKHTTYEGGVRVPFIVRWPGQVEAGAVTAEMGATLDIYATLIAAAGGEVPDGVDGHDLTPLWTGETQQSPRREFLYHRGRNVQGIRIGPWKLRTVDGDELFQLDEDPSERYNRAQDHPDIVAALRERIQGYEADVAEEFAPSPAEQ